MKLVIDEKLKHHLVGVAVVLSLGAIFLPAMMKNPANVWKIILVSMYSYLPNPKHLM